MSELLTTGEMIDRLKVGEIAEVVKVPFGEALLGDKVVFHCDSLVYQDTKQHFMLNDFTREMRWRILPNYISFEEAMQGLREGKSVSFHSDGKKFTIEPHEADMKRISSYQIGVFGLFTLLEGKWTIKED